MGLLKKLRKKFRRSRRWQWARTHLPEALFEGLFRKRRDVFFIWIPKCAGTSVYRVLVDNGCFERRWECPEASRIDRGLATFGHVGFQDLLRQQILTPEYAARAYKLAFVRNPYDRLVSLFYHLKKIQCPDVPQQTSFDDFCRKVCGGGIPPVGPYNYRGLNQCNPMVDWIFDENRKVLPSFIGRFESLENDFRTVCGVLGIRARLPHANRAKQQHEPYWQYYNAENKRAVARYYEKDLDMFKYTFSAG